MMALIIDYYESVSDFNSEPKKECQIFEYEKDYVSSEKFFRPSS